MLGALHTRDALAAAVPALHDAVFRPFTARLSRTRAVYDSRRGYQYARAPTLDLKAFVLVSVPQAARIAEHLSELDEACVSAVPWELRIMYAWGEGAETQYHVHDFPDVALRGRAGLPLPGPPAAAASAAAAAASGAAAPEEAGFADRGALRTRALGESRTLVLCNGEHQVHFRAGETATLEPRPEDEVKRTTFVSITSRKHYYLRDEHGLIWDVGLAYRWGGARFSEAETAFARAPPHRVELSVRPLWDGRTEGPAVVEAWILWFVRLLQLPAGWSSHPVYLAPGAGEGVGAENHIEAA